MGRSCQRLLALLLLGATCLILPGGRAETAPVSLRTDAYKDLGFTVDAPVILPEGYSQGKGLPTLKARRLDSLGLVQPEWFNESGIASTEDRVENEHAQRDTVFDDGSSLSVGESGWLHYVGAGKKSIRIHTLGTLARLRPMVNPREYKEALASTELPFGTLEDAVSQVEALMARLGPSSLRLIHALDLRLGRIQRLGEAHNKALQTYDPQSKDVYDYSALTEADECFFLIFCGEADGVPILENTYAVQGTGAFVSGMAVTVLVGQSGIAYLSHSGSYVPDGIATENEALLTAEEALAVFARDNGRVQRGHCEAVTEMMLVYAPVPDPEASGGFRLEPCWRILYRLNRAGMEAREAGFTQISLSHQVSPL
nr:hypothetical protein [Clostridia bacterium]